jgi:outer membrane immunogenic protein
MKQFSLAVFGIATSFSGLACGADLILPDVPDPAGYGYDWTGFHAGVIAGYGFGDADSVFGQIDPKGPIAGAEVGYDQDFGKFVLGGEADLQWTGMHGVITPGGDTITGNVDYYATLRGRVGLPFDKFMPYLTAGTAFAHFTETTTSLGGVTTSQQSVLGWTAGAGVAYAVTDAISLKAEYAYSDYGNVTYFAGTPVAETIHSSMSAIKVGVDFKF